MRRLLICAAPTAQAGAGHLSRALAVTEEAVAQGWTVRLVRDPAAPTWLATLAEDSGAELIDPGPPAGLVLGDGAEVLLVDGYSFGRTLRDAANARGALLVNIEDGAHGRRSADLVIDPGLGADTTLRPEDGSGKVLRGRDYALIRRAVREVVRAPTTSGTGTGTGAGTGAGWRVLVVMGGTDAGQLTEELLRLVGGLGPEYHAETARGAELPHQLGSVDAVISAAGVTALEACVIGTPLALIQVADNQARNYAELVGSGHAIGLGDPERIRGQPDQVADELGRLLRGEVVLADRGLLDGHGARRVCQAIATLAGA